MIRRTEFAALRYLRTALNKEQATFRPGQWEAIEALVARRERLLVVERTGWGKSSVYFIATRLLREQGAGPTLIVSPLLALMRNQVEAAERFGVRALTINSTNPGEWPTFHKAIQDNEVDALLVSPERLANDRFVNEVLMPIAGGVGLVVVDEAHCISDWGHDFRPDYRRLVNVLQRMPPNVPILGTTATANDRVVADVQAQLGNMGLQRGSLMRESLALQTIRLPSQSARLAATAYSKTDHADDTDDDIRAGFDNPEPVAKFPGNYRMDHSGLIWEKPSDKETPDIRRIAGPFEVLAMTRDIHSESWGALLRWRDADGRQHQLATARAMLAGDGREVRAALLSGGLYAREAGAFGGGQCGANLAVSDRARHGQNPLLRGAGFDLRRW